MELSAIIEAPITDEVPLWWLDDALIVERVAPFDALDSGAFDVVDASADAVADAERVFVSGEAHVVAIRALQDTAVQANALVAAQYAGIAELLRDAEAHPDPWVGPDPTLDPLWRDPRGRRAGEVRRERRDIAVRAAAADAAVRLRLSDATIRTRAAHADTLRERCPRTWMAFLSGEVTERNAITTAQLALSLPDDRDVWAVFDAQVSHPATMLAPAKFTVRARVIRERVHAQSLTERHQRAAEDRAVWLTPELDGMSSLAAFLPADAAQAGWGRVDAIARHLHAQSGETRTLAQLRADVLTDLLTRGETVTSGPGAGAPAVAITVPMMTLFGHDEPATLDGYGPIDPDTARRLAGGAKSWVRILTHPVTGTVLDVDRTTYRVPADLRRWLGVRHVVCVGPGCLRPARDCHIDHRIEWQHGGTTAATNNAPLCEPQHILKTKSLWELHRDETTGASWWITPTGYRVEPDPPPW